MSTVLFCIPLKPNHLGQYLEFLAISRDQHKQDWKDMLARYDIADVKIWHANIADREYVFVAHEVGPEFDEKIQGWEASEHPFDQWFKAQLATVYDASAVDAPAKQLFEMGVSS